MLSKYMFRPKLSSIVFCLMHIKLTETLLEMIKKIKNEILSISIKGLFPYDISNQHNLKKTLNLKT